MTKSKSSKHTGPKTDIFLAIHTKHVDNILLRRKNHEFRSWLLPDIQRMWLYETAPTKAVRYVMTVGPAKRPGEIAEDGLRNDAFNSGEMERETKHRYAYPIVKVHMLDKPLGLQEAKGLGWMGGAPQSFTYCTGVMLAEEGGRGRTVVFDCEAEVEAEAEAEATESRGEAGGEQGGDVEGVEEVKADASEEVNEEGEGKVEVPVAADVDGEERKGDIASTEDKADMENTARPHSTSRPKRSLRDPAEAKHIAAVGGKLVLKKQRLA